MAPTGADAACVQARSPARWARNSPPDAPPRLEDPLNEPFDFAGHDIGDGAVRAGETMPEPSDYLSEIQRDGNRLALTSSIGRRGSGSINVAVPIS